MINCQQGLVLRSKSRDLEAQMAGFLDELGFTEKGAINDAS
ncbi:hypothetical protein [Marinomonas primoryensis]